MKMNVVEISDHLTPQNMGETKQYLSEKYQQQKHYNYVLDT